MLHCLVKGKATEEYVIRISLLHLAPAQTGTGARGIMQIYVDQTRVSRKSKTQTKAGSVLLFVISLAKGFI
jgi:hypothetical protein